MLTLRPVQHVGQTSPNNQHCCIHGANTVGSHFKGIDNKSIFTLKELLENCRITHFTMFLYLSLVRRWVIDIDMNDFPYSLKIVLLVCDVINLFHLHIKQSKISQ